MNVYTHVDVADLAADIEGLLVLNDAGAASRPQPMPQDQPVAASSIADELVGLADNWASLPEHIRTAISILANV